MNKNDLIYRKDIERIICAGLNNKAYGYDAVCILAELRDLPAVEQPMSAAEYLIAEKRWSRWCFSKFSGPESLGTTCEDVRCEYAGKCLVCQSEPKKKVAFIEGWAQEHPEEVEE